jgi:hypothetical protein
MGTEPSFPTVFISYSHDDTEHKRWVLDLASALRANGIEVLIDAWDLQSGADVAKFMQRSVRESDRVLMICTERFVAKANEGVGGVGYEEMIITGEIVQNLGTSKFIPIIRQKSAKPQVPTSVSTRLYRNLSDWPATNSEMNELLQDLHNARPPKPPLGKYVPPIAAPRPVAESLALPHRLLLDELNQRFAGYLRIHAIAAHTPNVRDLGSLSVGAEVAELAEQEASRVKLNELHAILEGSVTCERDPATLYYRTASYATVKVLRGWALQEKVEWPLVISVAGVIISADLHEIYLHHKSVDTSSHGGLLHTPGGSFMPRRSPKAVGDSDLEYTMQREALEEIRTTVSARSAGCKLLTEQYATSLGKAFIQVAFLGVQALDRPRPERTHEGIVEIVSFNELPDYLSPTSPLVPTGKANILAWLALNCPGCPGASFGGRTPVDLYREVMASNWKPYGEPLKSYRSNVTANN